MATPKRMDQIRAILSNYLISGKTKITARQLKVSKNTVKTYVRRAEGYSSDLLKVLELDDIALEQIICGTESAKTDKRLSIFEGQVDKWLDDLRKVGVTRELIWREYRCTHPDGYGYSQFCEHLRRHVARYDLTLALEHNPGEVLMVDFAGKKMAWVDLHSGELHICEILVAVLPFSQYSFCIALPSQRKNRIFISPFRGWWATSKSA